MFASWVYSHMQKESCVSFDKEPFLYETSYTKNILLNEGIHASMAAQDQHHENLIQSFLKITKHIEDY